MATIICGDYSSQLIILPLRRGGEGGREEVVEDDDEELARRGDDEEVARGLLPNLRRDFGTGRRCRSF